MDAAVYALPSVLWNRQAQENFDRSREVMDLNVAVQLHVHNWQMTLKAFSEEYSKLDALAADCGCERRAMIIFDLATSAPFRQEVENLKVIAKRVRDQFYELKGKNHFNEITVKKFFQENLRSITVSSRMAYLLQAHLLTYTKVSVDNVKEKTEPNRLDKLAKVRKVLLSPAIIRETISHTQSELSIRSVEFVQKMALDLKTLPQEEKDLLCTMLKVTRVSAPVFGILPKTFICQFYSLKACLVYLLENRAYILVKKWLKKKEDVPMRPLVFHDNRLLSIEEEQSLSKSNPVVVFEGEVGVERERLAELILQYSLREVFLVASSQEEQFEHGSDGLEYIPLKEAKEEIQRYRKKGEEMGIIKGNKSSFFLLDHAYCSSMKEEKL